MTYTYGVKTEKKKVNCDGGSTSDFYEKER
jgi:hypothetical protein